MIYSYSLRKSKLKAGKLDTGRTHSTYSYLCNHGSCRNCKGKLKGNHGVGKGDCQCPCHKTKEE